MNTFQQKHFLSEIASANPISDGTLAYFRERLRNNLYDFIVTKFLEEKINGLTKTKLGERTGHSAAVITRLLGAPGNWTLDTISDLLIGISGEELTPASCLIANRPHRNYTQPAWFNPSQSGVIASGATSTGAAYVVGGINTATTDGDLVVRVGNK